jgi:thiosulfate dehydrogenase (quinone) large subunit
MDRVSGAVSSRLGQVAWGLAAVLAAAFLIFEIGEHLFSERVGQFFLMLLLLLGAFLVFVYLINRTREDRIDERRIETIGEPGVAHYLFHDTRSAPLWLVVRLYLGFAWLEGGWEKLAGNPSWLSSSAGIRGYWERAVVVPQGQGGRAPITYDWWRDFLNFMLANNWDTWFAPTIAIGELLVGIGLITGVLTGWAAFFGMLMNMSFMLSGSASTNPVLFSLSILLILAWRVAGFLGGDRYVLPFLGVPGLGRPASQSFGGTVGHGPEATGAPAD